MSSRSTKKSISKQGRSSPERPKLSLQIPPHFSAVLLVISASALFLVLLRAPMFLIGDGREYGCSAMLWGKNVRPFHPESEVRACIQQLLPGDPYGAVGWTAVNGQVESFHFWALPLLVSPFVPLARVAGLGPLHAWPLFHWALSIFALLWIRRGAGPWFAPAVLLVFATSPLIFWANKAHNEFYVCTMLLLGFVAIWRGRLLEGTLWLSLASLQQTTLAVPALLCFGAVLLFRRQPAHKENRGLILAIVGIQVLSPLYYLLRLGRPTLPALANSISPKLLSFHRAMSLLVDPDIGILQAWPQGIVFCVVCIIVLTVSRDRALARLGAAVLAFLLVEPLVISMQGAWNSGGTVYIQRYSLYLLTAITVAGIAAIASVKLPALRVGLAVAGAVLLIAGFRYRTWPTFSPGQPENYMTRSDLAHWVYADHPNWYDPEPEVFVERIIQQDLMAQPIEAAPKNVWAYGNHPCTKLYIVKSPEQLRAMSNPGSPVGCREPNDALVIFRDLAEGRIQPTRLGYVNVTP